MKAETDYNRDDRTYNTRVSGFLLSLNGDNLHQDTQVQILLLDGNRNVIHTEEQAVEKYEFDKFEPSFSSL